jgi:hypothetical protein
LDRRQETAPKTMVSENITKAKRKNQAKSSQSNCATFFIPRVPLHGLFSLACHHIVGN